MAVDDPPPTLTSDAVHEPRIQRVQNVVVARHGVPISCKTDGSDMSSAQGSYWKYTFSSAHTRHLHTTSVARERERPVTSGLLGEVVDIAFQGNAAHAVGGCHTQPMMEARNLGCSSIVFSGEIPKSAMPLGIQRQKPRMRWRCDEVQQGYTCRDMDQTLLISQSTLPQRTAQVPYNWSQRRRPRITCVNGNGDVKPDHPSGPGTYGHVV